MIPVTLYKSLFFPKDKSFTLPVTVTRKTDFEQADSLITMVHQEILTAKGDLIFLSTIISVKAISVER